MSEDQRTVGVTSRTGVTVADMVVVVMLVAVVVVTVLVAMVVVMMERKLG
jgi:hypothetical protein